MYRVDNLHLPKEMSLKKIHFLSLVEKTRKSQGKCKQIIDILHLDTRGYFLGLYQSVPAV
jgi:hypothetical protein